MCNDSGGGLVLFFVQNRTGALNVFGAFDNSVLWGSVDDDERYYRWASSQSPSNDDA